MDTPHTATQPALHPACLIRDPRAKSPSLAALLSCFPGLGQVYVGATRQGFIHLGVIAATITLLSAGLGGLEPLLGIFLPFYWGYNLIDAHQRATRLNLALQGLAPGEQPVEAEGQPLTGVLGGSLLVIFGLLALAHRTFGLSLAWLERGWPVLFILAGIAMVWHSLKGRRSQVTEETQEL